MKLCKDCKWISNPVCEESYCLNPNIHEKSSVTGNVLGDLCVRARIFENRCGENAKYFEDKENV